jgi:hypothetical protein
MQTIWKENFNLADKFSLKMPKGAEILSVGLDPRGALAVWFINFNDNPDETEEDYVARCFLMLGTGHPFPVDRSKLNYLGQVQQGPFVWHIFEYPEGAQNADS